MKRSSFQKHFLDMAILIAKRSTCLRRQIGAVATLNNRVVATGYNGPPSGIMHCEERGGCLREQMGIPSGQRLDVCSAVHAEQNLIVQCTLDGRTLTGCTIYCTHKPCFTCAKLLVAAKVSCIVYINDYPDALSDQLFDEAKIATMVYTPELPNDFMG